MTMSMDNQLSQKLPSYSVDSENKNNNPHGNILSGDSDQSSDTESEESMDSTDSSCATDFELYSLGKCGLKSCEYGPSVDGHDVLRPTHMHYCTKMGCGWIVCRECYRNGGHKRHKKYMELLEFCQNDV